MKRAIAIALLFTVVLCSAAFAHPPKDIKITFNLESKEVTAVIIHPVSNPEKHYIKKVNIAINGKEVFENTLTRQDNNNDQTVIYALADMKAGDMISVEGYCNLSGKLLKEIKVE